MSTLTMSALAGMKSVTSRNVTFVIAGIRGDEECTAAVESFYADQS